MPVTSSTFPGGPRPTPWMRSGCASSPSGRCCAPLYEEGPVVKWCVGMDGRGEHDDVSRRHGSAVGAGWVRLVPGDHRWMPPAAEPLAGWCSSLYRLLDGRIRSDWSVRLAHLIRGPSRGQRVCVGPCRAERGLGGEHVPDGLGELAGDLDAGDLGAALAAEPGLGRLVMVAVAGVTGGMGGGLQQRPPQVAGAVLAQRPAMVTGAGLVDPGAQPG